MHYRQTVFTVFRRPLYLVMAVVIALLVLLLAIWLPNRTFIWETIISDRLLMGDKVSILIASLGAIKTNFTFASRATTILVALLTGVNLALLTYHVRQRIGMGMAGGSGVLGTVAGLIGIGCASCGSVILSSIFGVAATSGFIGIFPLKGVEFGILGILLLLWANKRLLEKIAQPGVCKI